MTRPRLLDLFCGAGGSAVGYHRAGFEVVGVDIKPQPHYPFEFHQADALSILRTMADYPTFSGEMWRPGYFDAIHASPPCQAYSMMAACRPGLAEAYPRLIEPTRELLKAIGLPWVIENVVGAPLHHPMLLCGFMFDLDLYRHRLFECGGFATPFALHPPHGVPGSGAGHWEAGRIISVSGNCAPIALARKAMGIDWMDRDELKEAIPPAYTQFIGELLLAHLSRVTATPGATANRAAASSSPHAAGGAPGGVSPAVALDPTSEEETPGADVAPSPSDPMPPGEVAVPATAAVVPSGPSPGGSTITRRPVLLDDVRRLATRSTIVQVRTGIL